MKPKLLTATKTNVPSVVGAPKREVLRSTVEKTLRDKILDGCEVEEDEVQESSYQFIKYVLAHLDLVATGTLDSILALNVD